MTLEQAYKKVYMMDKVLDSDILNDEEYTSIAKRRFKLMEQIGLEEQRQKQLATYKPKRGNIMTLNELYAVNGDWKYNPNIIFEFHYPRDEHANNLNPYCKINWNQVSENAKNSNVLYFETISKSRVWIELDI